MIETELYDFEKLGQSMKGSKEKAEKEMKDEKAQVEEMLQSLDSDIVRIFMYKTRYCAFR